MIPKKLQFGPAYAVEWKQLKLARQPCRQVQTESIESNGFKTLPQNLTELREAGAGRQCVCGAANANAIGNYVTLIKSTISHATQFHEFVITQLPDPNQDPNPNHYQNPCNRGLSRIQEKETEQTKAGAYAIQQQNCLPVGDTPAEQLVMNMFAIRGE